MKKPLVSVIIPAYNEEDYIQPCLDSVVNLKFPNSDFEVIVIDNNSTDNTSVVIKKNFPKVKIVKEEKQGVVFARMRGVNEARGSIIAFTDADSCVPEMWLQNIYTGFGNHQIVAIGGLIEYHPKSFWSPIKQYIANSSYSFFKSMSGANMSFRKDFYRMVGGFSPKVNTAEDAYISFKLKRTGKIKILKENTVITSSRRTSLLDSLLFEVKYLASVLSFLLIKRKTFYHFKAIRNKGFINP